VFDPIREGAVMAGWKKGPMPKNTWNWGGVVPAGQGSYGFMFADFHGDHVILCPSGKRLEPHEVAFYNNSLELPPKAAAEAVVPGGKFAEEVQGRRLE
jgi:hypothetical protein